MDCRCTNKDWYNRGRNRRNPYLYRKTAATEPYRHNHNNLTRQNNNYCWLHTYSRLRNIAPMWNNNYHHLDNLVHNSGNFVHNQRVYSADN
jgi:hypothetical protein